MKTQIVEAVTIRDAKETLSLAAKTYFATDRSGRPLLDRRRARPVCLLGAPGLGKTEIVRQVAEEQGLALVSYSITHHTRQSLLGLPRLVEGVAEGRTVSMTEYTMSEIVADIYRTGRDRGILFLDEFNCASESIRPVLLQLLQDKAFGPHKIPDGWMLVLAGNPPAYNRSAADLDPVSADRMRMVHVKPDYPVWRDYAVGHGVHPMVLTYLDLHPEDFYCCRQEDDGMALVTARAWEDLSCVLQALEGEGQEPSLSLTAQYLQSASVARGFFSHWTQYRAVVASGLVDRLLGGVPKAAMTLKGLPREQTWSVMAVLLRRLAQLAQEWLDQEETVRRVHQILGELKEPAQGMDPAELCMALSDQADSCQDKPVRDFLLDRAVPAACQGWEAVSALFMKELRPRLTEAEDRAAQALNDALALCRQALEGQPQLEFLLYSICDNRALVELLGLHRSQEFSRLFEETYFEPGTAGDHLLQLVGGALPADEEEEAASW